jgi:hypothetical protein
MNWITKDVAIGSYHEALDRDLLSRESIRSILSLSSHLAGKQVTDLGVERIETVTLLDGPGNELSRFARAVSQLETLVQEDAPVLVHCRAGWSRSPAVVAGYLIRSGGKTSSDALTEVTSKRACSMVPELKRLVEKFGNMLRSEP